MASSGHPQEEYPSPAPPTQHAGLPFYQHPADLQQQRQIQRDVGEQGGDPASVHAGEQDAHHEVPDDPALRSHLASIMGTFDAAFGQPQYHEREHDASLADSAAFASAAASTDAPPASADRRNQRSKVSRACDECRRKKIRCDALDETSSAPCTSCARTGAKCAFSRQPLKRGPSKGYIKELAERLNSLEKQVHPPGALQEMHQVEIQRVQRQMAEGLRAYGQDGVGEASEPRTGDKRTHAMTETENHSSRRAPSEVSQTLSYSPIQSVPGRSQSSMQPFWRRGGVERRDDHSSFSFETENSTAILNFDWDEDVVDEYYRIIHQTFPLLPNSKNRLRQRLADCPASLREAFLAALDCLMRTFPTTTLPFNSNYDRALKKAGELLAKYPFDNPSTHTDATNLVYLQTLLLMTLETDNHGPATIRGQAGPSRAEWLGRAAGVAGQLEINVLRSGSQSIMEGDRDSEARLARRVWWVLFILDRWHASSTADLLKLPENSVILLPEDQILLGESTYHLARLSFIIGHLASILTTTKTPSADVMAPSNPASSLLSLTLAGEIDRFRESVESVWGSLNLVHLSYHHCHLLIKRLSPTTEPTELSGHAVKVATVLNSRLTPVTPLNHHFGALAAMTLCELCDVPRTRADALRGLEHMSQALGEGRGLAGKTESQGWDGAIRELVLRKRERMLSSPHPAALDGLPDPAAATPSTSAGGGGGAESFDPTTLTCYGYLTALGQERFQTR